MTSTAPLHRSGKTIRRGTEFIALVSSGLPHDEAKALAQLFAASPKLLEALKGCVIERSEWLIEARAAITEAEGKP